MNTSPERAVPTSRARWSRFAGISACTFLLFKLVGVLAFGDPIVSHLAPALGVALALGWFAALRSPARDR